MPTDRTGSTPLITYSLQLPEPSHGWSHVEALFPAEVDSLSYLIALQRAVAGCAQLVTVSGGGRRLVFSSQMMPHELVLVTRQVLEEVCNHRGVGNCYTLEVDGPTDTYTIRFNQWVGREVCNQLVATGNFEEVEWGGRLAVVKLLPGTDTNPVLVYQQLQQIVGRTTGARLLPARIPFAPED